MFRLRFFIHSSGLLTVALAALVFLGRCGQPPDSERRVVHEWAVEPTDLMAQGKCEEAIRLLENVPQSRRDGIWYYTHVLSSLDCIRKHQETTRYETSMLENLAEGERLHPEDASIKLWYGVGLKRIGSEDAAREKFKEARALATAVLERSPGSQAAYESRVVLENLDANGD